MLTAVEEPVTPFTTAPAWGESVAVAGGVHWVRLPLPFRLNHVNIWLIEGDDGWTVVDTGLDDDLTRALWDGPLTRRLGDRPVIRVIATHFHPDHIGLAGRLVAASGASFHTGLAEWLYARALCFDSGPSYLLAAERFYRRAGLATEDLDRLLRRGNAYARMVRDLPPTVERLRPGDRMVWGGHPWRVIGGAGHSPEPVCLLRQDDSLLIVGDQVLPRITPNIAVWPTEPDADPLADYLAGFAALAGLPADTLVLPSHGLPFRGLKRRLDDIAAHHAERLSQVEALCRRPVTGAAVADALFGHELDAHQRVFAVGEAIAHLNHLLRRDRILRRPDTDGVLIYESAAS
jgi:glyoxylase-like metal-dependent hydrolase (beta-lactamase superfamily II)